MNSLTNCETVAICQIVMKIELRVPYVGNHFSLQLHSLANNSHHGGRATSTYQKAIFYILI